MTIDKLKLLFCVVVFSVLPQTTFGQAVPFLDQVFDFEDLSLAGFANGAAVGPFVVADANGNNALQVVTSGAPGGAGAALVVLNNALSGDLTAATAVLFDATNPNPSDLNIRFSFSDPSNVFISNDIVLPAGTTDSLSFLLDSNSFVQANGTGSFSQALANVDQIRILNNVNASIGAGGLALGAPVLDLAGNPIAGSLLVDNFVVSSAPVAAVPEPSCISLLFGLAGVIAASRRRTI